MNILYLIESSEGGGAETVVLSLAKAFRGKGHNCIIGLLQPGWLAEQLKTEGFEPITIHQARSYDVRCIQELVEIIRKARIDIVHAHEFMMNTYGSLAGLLTGKPVVTTVHGKNYYPFKKRRRAAYRLVSRLSKMVAVSKDLGRFVNEAVGVSKKRITTIYNGVDLNGGDRGLAADVVKSKKEALLIPDRSPVVGTVGMLVEVKDHVTMIKAAAKVVKRHPEVIFLFCGDGELKGRLEEEARRLGIIEHVRLPGFRRDIFDLLQVMDIYVCSSLSEGLSLSLLEAMVTGKPVIATSVGGNPEIVSNDGTGILVPPQDPEALASKIALLLDDRLFAQQMGRRGQAFVTKRFSQQRMVDNYERLYNEMI